MPVQDRRSTPSRTTSKVRFTPGRPTEQFNTNSQGEGQRSTRRFSTTPVHFETSSKHVSGSPVPCSLPFPDAIKTATHTSRSTSAAFTIRPIPTLFVYDIYNYFINPLLLFCACRLVGPSISMPFIYRFRHTAVGYNVVRGAVAGRRRRFASRYRILHQFYDGCFGELEGPVRLERGD